MSYEKPSSNSRLRVSLQFLRHSEALVPGPVWMMYSEKVTSRSVLVLSIWTSAVPAGQPEPRSDTPRMRTLSGTMALGTSRPRAVRVSAGAAAARGRRARSETGFIMKEFEVEVLRVSKDECDC
jgi:hypothetical protein